MNQHAEPAKKTQIVRAARRLFRRHGVKRVTVEEIAREAEVSKVTFYKYFPNKIELVKHILAGLADATIERIREVQAMDLPFVDKVTLLMNERLHQARTTSAAFIDEFFHMEEPELRDFVGELMASSQRRFLQFVTDAQAQGHFREDVRPEFVLALLQKLNELAADERLKEHYPDYEAFTKEIHAFFFHGLLA